MALPTNNPIGETENYQRGFVPPCSKPGVPSLPFRTVFLLRYGIRDAKYTWLLTSGHPMATRQQILESPWKIIVFCVMLVS